MSLFYSPDFEKKYPHLRLAENRTYALSYYLQQVIPKGGVVEAFPGPLLSAILPSVALQKNCKVKCLALAHELARLNLLANSAPDLTIVEPVFFVEGGALVQPGFVSSFQNLVGVGSVSQWTDENPASLDFVPLSKTVTEIGVFSPDEFLNELRLYLKS